MEYARSDEYYKEYVEKHSAPQSMQFMIDILPTIRKVTRGWPFDKTMSVLDVGSGSCAGSNLLAQLYNDNFFGFPMQVSAIDKKPMYEDYARKKFPLVNFKVGDIWKMEETPSYDLVICSHVIEHFKYPLEIVKKCRALAKRWAIFYTPYKEQNRIGEHFATIDDTIINAFVPISVEYIVSHAWHAIKNEPCVIFVLRGGQITDGN